MTRLPDRVIGDAYASDHAWAVLTDLVEVGNRMAGQEGEREGAEVVSSALHEAGAREVEIDEFEIDGWWRGDASLSVPGRGLTREADHDVIALPGTPAGDASGPLVDVGTGTPEEFERADLEGAVAMASSRTPEDHDRWIHRMEKYVMATKAGADGFVFRNHVEGCLPPTGEIGYHERPGPIPAVGVSAELGARLARYANSGTDRGSGDGEDDPGATDDRGPEVELAVDCRNAPATSRNVEAVLGPDTHREVLVTAHVDAHDVSEGANDNGAGSAIVCEIARLLAAAEDELDTRVRCITFGAEEIGLWGAYHWVESNDLGTVECVVNVDGAGGSRDPRVGTNGFEGMEAAFEAVCADLGAPLSTSEEIMPHGDQWAFVQKGIPAVFASADTGSSGRGYGHTHADTLDKLDRRDLRALSVVFAEAVLELASEDRAVEHRSTEAIRAAIDEGYEQELKRGGRWPYDE
jgi:Zn-dependent M28 family amino/carboxypeptidase